MKSFIYIIVFIVPLNLCSINQVDTISIQSNIMKKSVKSVVITPDSYSNCKKYPVVYLLHGYSDNYSKWVKTVPEIISLCNRYNFIIVCPDGGYSSWYMDSPLDSTYQYESFVCNDLIQYIDNHYATIPNRTGRAITGLSMGGFGALYLSIRNKSLFAFAGSMSGGVDLCFSTKKFDISKRIGDFESNSHEWKRRSIINMIDSLQNNELELILDCGQSDFFYEINKTLHFKLLTKGIEHDYIERPGKHNWEYWANAVQYQFLFFHSAFKHKYAR